MKSVERILLVDDDALTVEQIIGFLHLKGYEVALARTGAMAREVVGREPIGLMLLDLQLRGENGLDLLPQLKKLNPEMSVIILTGYGTIKDAVEAMRRGADNFVDKCVGLNDFLTIIEKGLEAYQLRRKNVQLKRLTTPSQSVILAESSAMRDVLQLVEAVAERDTTVLLYGETGTGKELVARRIHELSSRNKEPFVEVNCAALQRELEALLNTEKFDLAIVDLRLSGGGDMEGLELISTIKTQTPETQVVLFTGYGSTEIERAARERGANDYWEKTMKVATLIERLRVLGVGQHK